jgi:hypothetical protein
MKFFKDVYFSSVTFFGDTSFEQTIFAGKAWFGCSRFTDSEQTRFSNAKFNYWDNRLEKPSADFFNVDFPKSVLFHQTDLSRVSFTDANIEQARFDECKFGYVLASSQNNKAKESVVFKRDRKHNRNILWDAYAALQDSDSESGTFENVEIRYRQFKKNFEDKKDWETAGDFYHGEMLMRLQKFRAERRQKVIEPPWWPPVWIWHGIVCNRSKTFFLCWYRWISDFNESPVRALSWLFILISLFGFCFWLLLADPGKSFHYALTSAIPLFDFPAALDAGLGPKGIGLHYAEVFLSAIVWTLLVLSVRQKFRR